MPGPLSDKTFSDADQQRFAAASGDFNPMHVDAVAARRLLSGRQVVHGIHVLMHALERHRPDPGPGATEWVCNFANPVSVGDRVEFARSERDGRCVSTASVDGLVCAEIVCEPEVEGLAPVLAVEQPARVVPPLTRPLDEVPGSQGNTLIELPLPQADLEAEFPRAASLLGLEGLRALAACSTFVGMVCPGLHSVFSSLRFTSVARGSGAMRFRVRKYDSRFHLFIVDFVGPIRGELRAFVRPPPQPQPAMPEIITRVAAEEFRGSRSLVVGGSRGLGESTAKILAAGGGDVVISYAAGEADARAVAAEINATGRGACDVLALDLQQPIPTQLLSGTHFDAVYFFATPRIYAKRAETFDRQAFDAFVNFYLQRFYELCRALEQAGRGKTVVYLPSTVFIDERPKGMTEYAMAKAAAEVLADDVNRSFARVRVLRTRLPRLATDQTSSILDMKLESNLDALLPVVRQMSNAISSL